MTTTQLKLVMPRAPMAWLIALAGEMAEWGITTPERISAFLGQIAHESAELTRLEENLNYSAERLVAVWPKRFPNAQAAAGCARNPEALANRVYANRMGNGDEASGDGWRYRGRGPIQLTGRDNYYSFGVVTGLPLLEQPDDVASVPAVGCRVACAFWKARGLNDLADKGDHAAITKRVNGGTHGLNERIHYASEALRVLAA